ncbi:drug/metabolite transporter (DMT)-like permease [Lysobacter sp. OAE881]|uniref:hypothetical protein n=1 Tax=Lysobacter sp. OAE881 TaxID=2663813 RepID=UPI001789FC11
MSIKSLGYGIAAFLAAYALMAFFANALVEAGVYASGGVVIQIMGYLVPVFAGYVAASKAPRWRIAHGIVGGSIGIMLAMLAPMLIDPEYTPSGTLVILVWFAVLAALGAVFGDHVAKKRAA